MTLIASTLPFVHPSDEQLARALMDEVVELARQEQAARELCEKLEREKIMVDEPEFAI